MNKNLPAMCSILKPGNLLLLALFILIYRPVFSQDIHFSQFYASPLTLNPAMTGFSEGDYRLAAIYRNQWWSITSFTNAPYVTYALSYDMRLLQDKIGEDLFGIGGVFFNDRAGGGTMNTFSGMLSSAYHKALGSESNHYLGLGVQVGYVQKSLKYDELLFPDQYIDGDFVPDAVPNGGEAFANGNINQVDFQTSLLWHMRKSNKLALFNGFSMFHITQPKENFLLLNSDDEKNRLSSRYVIHGGAKIRMTESLYLTPNYIFMLQSKAREINLGTALEFYLRQSGRDATVLSVGGWYRIKDAAIANVTIEHNRFRVGVSYDITLSGLQRAATNVGALEISLVYQGFLSKTTATEKILFPCPRM